MYTRLQHQRIERDPGRVFRDDPPPRLTTLAIANYRSIRQIVLPLGRLNVVRGANGSGKSNLYRALRLLSDTARGGIIGTLAREGGFDSTLARPPTSANSLALRARSADQTRVHFRRAQVSPPRRARRSAQRRRTTPK
jgi:predicted ATPase